MLNSEKLKAFPLSSETRQGCPLLPLLFNILLKFLAWQSEKKKKKNRNWKRSKLSLFANDMILYVQNSKDAIRNFLGAINEFGKVTGYKINTQKSLAFLYTNSERSEREIQETIPFTTTSKRIKQL